ncbi:TPA: hypothetical protein DEP94_00405 [Candidatus Nomurabacteria bacterium]|nr:hypothetical protein [Candidatus Nomurabacteria bacterium]
MEQMTNRKYLILLAVLLLITASSAIIPASWFGVSDKKSDASSDLTSVQIIDTVGKNKEGGPATWKDLTEMAFKNQPEELAKLKETPVNQKDLDILNDPDNLTASFSKNLFVSSTYLNENGGGDETTQDDILNQLMEQELAKIIPTTYLVKDINVSQAESKDSIKTYGNNLALILKDMITEASIKEGMAGVFDYLNTQNEKSLEPVTNDYKKVDTIIKKLLALSVPLSASTYHIITVNQVAEYRDNLYNLSQLANDPLRGRISLEKYVEVSVYTLSLYKDLSKYFDTKNVVFSAKDAGYVFTAGYTMK